MKLIPVTERLPDDTNQKLVYCAGAESEPGSMGFVAFNFGWYCRDIPEPKWIVVKERYGNYPVTHWCDLPYPDEVGR